MPFWSVVCAFLWGLTAFANNSQSFILISDIDDTIKITNVRSYKDLIQNGLFGDRTFLGMSDLYQGWAENAEQIYYVSGSPQSLESRLRSILLVQSGFPEGGFFLKNWFGFQDTYRFKLNTIGQILSNHDRPVLLVGDDQERDSDVFTEIRAQYPDRILGVYIHRVAGEALPDGHHSFSNAFELGLSEFRYGRISVETLLQVGQRLVGANQWDLVFPSFKECISNDSQLSSTLPGDQEELRDLIFKVNAQMVSYCNARN